VKKLVRGYAELPGDFLSACLTGSTVVELGYWSPERRPRSGVTKCNGYWIRPRTCAAEERESGAGAEERESARVSRISQGPPQGGLPPPPPKRPRHEGRQSGKQSAGRTSVASVLGGSCSSGSDAEHTRKDRGSHLESQQGPKTAAPFPQRPSVAQSSTTCSDAEESPFVPNRLVFEPAKLAAVAKGCPQKQRPINPRSAEQASWVGAVAEWEAARAAGSAAPGR